MKSVYIGYLLLCCFFQHLVSMNSQLYYYCAAQTLEEYAQIFPSLELNEPEALVASDVQKNEYAHALVSPDMPKSERVRKIKFHTMVPSESGLMVLRSKKEIVPSKPACPVCNRTDTVLVKHKDDGTYCCEAECGLCPPEYAYNYGTLMGLRRHYSSVHNVSIRSKNYRLFCNMCKQAISCYNQIKDHSCFLLFQKLQK